MINRRFLEGLRKVGPIKFMEPLSHHTTWGVGGFADVFMIARSEEQLRWAFVLAQEYGVPCLVLGAGSNILVGDEGFRGLVIENRAAKVVGPYQDGKIWVVRAASGARLASLARGLARSGFQGLEWACGIPGTVGGAVVYNAGAYGGCLADVLTRAWLASGDGRVLELGGKELSLGYRGSAFTRGAIAGMAIQAVEVQVWPAEAPALEAKIKQLEAQRRQAQPRGRNAGSVFKNPPDRPAWWYVEQVGLKGWRIGNAYISQKHANFIINLGGAKARDIKALIDLARERVRRQFGLELELEVALVGEGF